LRAENQLEEDEEDEEEEFRRHLDGDVTDVLFQHQQQQQQQAGLEKTWVFLYIKKT
jgi:hypothetical protein